MFQTTNQISIEHHQTPCSSFSASHFDSHQKGQDPDDHERFEPRPSTCSRVFNGSLMILVMVLDGLIVVLWLFYCVLWRLMVVSMVFYGCLMAFDGSFCPKKWKCNQLQGGYETAATFHMFHDRSYSHSLHIPFKLKGIMFRNSRRFNMLLPSTMGSSGLFCFFIGMICRKICKSAKHDSTLKKKT